MPIFCKDKSRFKLVVYLKETINSKYVSETGKPKIVEYSPLRKNNRSELLRIYKRAKFYNDKNIANSILIFDNKTKNLVTKYL